MEAIQQASIYKLLKQDKYLIHSLSRLQMGASIASEPFIWLNGNSSLNKVVEQMQHALINSKTGVPNPKDWKEHANAFLEKTGLKKQRDLYKDSILVNVQRRNGILIFIPMKNEGSKGFVNVSKETIEVPGKASTDEISHAFEKALGKAE